MNARGLLAVMFLTVSACGNEDGLLGTESEGKDTQSDVASRSEELALGESDYYHCFAAGGCPSPDLATSTRCIKGRDYQVTISEKGKGVIVLSFHGGLIEPNSSELARAISSELHYSLYDFAAHGTSACLGTYNDFSRLHITSANFDDPEAVRVVSRHKKAVAIHGYDPSRGNNRGTICVGGANTAQVKAFIAAVNQRKSEFTLYSLRAVNAATAQPVPGADCSGIAGTARLNLVNRTADSAGGLQLEMSNEIKLDLLSSDSRYSTLRSIFYGAISAAMNE